jgi:hypothetical protein
MSKQNDNRVRALADVVTIDAWHRAFHGKNRSADLHADVVFGLARVGGEIESPVRFRLSVRRAEVLVIIPENEPLSVNRETVSRESSHAAGILTEVSEKKAKMHAKGDVESGIGLLGPSATIRASVGGDASISTNRKVEVSTPIRLFRTTQSKTEEGHYRWIVESETSNPLNGRPWDSSAPRLTLIDNGGEVSSKSLQPTVRVEVRCRREDLIIEDIELKDESIWSNLTGRAGFNNRMAAAESYIRDQLIRLGLEVKNIEDKFGQLTMASATADAVPDHRK